MEVGVTVTDGVIVTDGVTVAVGVSVDVGVRVKVGNLNPSSRTFLATSIHSS